MAIISTRLFMVTVYMKFTVYMRIWITLLIFDCVLNGVMPLLQTFALDRAMGMLSAGQTIANIARSFNVNSATISHLRCRFQLKGNVNVAPRSGRPRSLSNADDRYIRLASLRDRF